MNSNMKKRLLIPIYIILFSLLVGCINQSSSTKAPKFSAAELQQAEQIDTMNVEIAEHIKSVRLKAGH